MSETVTGNLAGLKPSQKKALEKLGERRMRADVLVTPELAQSLCALSVELRRTIGVLLDRRGNVEHVIVGDVQRLYLPDIGRARAGGRLRGVRLVRAIPGEGELSRDDLTDLSKLMLDAVAVIESEPSGHAGRIEWAHVLPPNPRHEFWRRERLAHPSHLPEGFGEWVTALEAELDVKRERGKEARRDRAALVYVRTRDDKNPEAHVHELHELCRTASIEVVETYVQSRSALDPRFALGKGALEEVELRCLQAGADMIIFGQELTPAQNRGISEATQLRVIDRTQLILDIFAQRAQSRVGKIQVELAQLAYRLPRLSGRGSSMSRLAGGIGGRGPGETKLEVDRRRARDRMRALEKEVARLGGSRELLRKGRREHGVPVVSIIGYTNAGKSTLLNTLTNAAVLAEDKLFATLDPTSRRLRFPRDREVVLTDTVGFIRDLPKELVEAFRATLEEMADADLLLHVIDASDPARLEQMRSTQRILDDLGLAETPRIVVWNKVDRLDEAQRAELLAEHDGVALSANDKASTRVLIDTLDRWLLAHGHADVVPENPEREPLPWLAPPAAPPAPVAAADDAEPAGDWDEQRVPSVAFDAPAIDADTAPGASRAPQPDRGRRRPLAAGRARR
jgi:GTP-binding protein HflX